MDQEDNNNVLREWYEANGGKSAYPSNEEKEELAAASGKSVKQVSGWFSRNRIRDRGTYPDHVVMIYEALTESQLLSLQKIPNLVLNQVLRYCTNGMMRMAANRHIQARR